MANGAKYRYKSEKFQKIDAEKLAKEIGCSGAHKGPDGKWLPCASEEELQKLSTDAEPPKKPVGFYDKKDGKPRRKKRGKRKRYINDGWENLRLRAPLGFDTLPDGSLVSGNNPPTPAVGETVTAFGGGIIPGITNSGTKSALGQSIGERANGTSSTSSSSGVDRDGDGIIDEGTDNERPAQRKKPAPGTERGAAEGKRPLPPKTAPKKRKRQIVYPGGIRHSRSFMPLGPDPKNYPEDEYELVTPEGKPYDRSKKPHEQGKSVGDGDVETKAGQMVGPEYVRDNDPDVFMDPESARFRSRQLGCIGISRRISKTGRAVWMPCTNMSDYSRVSGSTAQGRRGQQRDTEKFVRTIVSRELKKNKR